MALTLHLLDASEKALCLDGSPPGYYWRQGTSTRLLIGLLGGGWCSDPHDCLARSRTVYGSSSKWPKTIDGMGVTSADARSNPAFADWSVAFLWYCDGTSYSSDLSEPLVVNGSALHFRGRRIWEATLRSLRRTLAAAEDVVLYGESAGGVGCFTHLDALAAAVPTGVRVRGVCDSSFFGADVSMTGAHRVAPLLHKLWAQYNLSAALDTSCAAAHAPLDRWRCLLPPTLYPFLSTPVFVLQSLYDCEALRGLGLGCLPPPDDAPPDVPACRSDQQLGFFQGFAERMRTSLERVNATGGGSAGHNGLYADSCIHHSIGLFGGYWGAAEWTVSGVGAAQAVDAWLSDAPGPHQHVDKKAWPHNEQCVAAFETCLGKRSQPPWQCGPAEWQVHKC